MISERYLTLQNKKALLEKELRNYKLELKNYEVLAQRHSEAQIIIQKAAQETTEYVKNIVTKMSSEALSTLLDAPHTIKLEFLTRGKQNLTLEADLKLVDENGNETDMMKSNGGGVKDFASLLLRLSIHAITNPSTRKVFIFDEPLISVSDDLRELAGVLMKQLSDKLGIQIIMTTNEEKYKQIADKKINTIEGY